MSVSRGDGEVVRLEIAPVPSPPTESTVGTGSVFAVGCAVLSLLVILVGIAAFVLLRLF